MNAPKTRRLLLVEDHAAFAGAMETVLRISPHLDAVVVARTLREGREVALGGLGFDIAVMDLRLSDGESTGLIEEIKERMPGMPVLVLSNSMDLSGALRAGADAALHKDADLSEVLRVVESLVVRADRP